MHGRTSDPARLTPRRSGGRDAGQSGQTPGGRSKPLFAHGDLNSLAIGLVSAVVGMVPGALVGAQSRRFRGAGLGALLGAVGGVLGTYVGGCIFTLVGGFLGGLAAVLVVAARADD